MREMPRGPVGCTEGPRRALATSTLRSALERVIPGSNSHRGLKGARGREVGIRTALSAQTGDVVKLVIAEGMSPALAGIAVGALVAVASARVLQTLAFGISAIDPPTLAAVSALLAVVALLASRVPRFPVRPGQGAARRLIRSLGVRPVPKCGRI